MSLKAELGPQLPYLRRYARALTGSQTLGDTAVRKVLQALLASPQDFDCSRPPRTEIYRVFHQLWAENGNGKGAIGRLPAHTRQALLLTTIENFSIAQAAEILESNTAIVTAEIEAARQTIADSLRSRVLIIEDEAIIALHLRSIVEELGHTVAGIARTRADAAALAASVRPELVLADISLADGSSGIDAVKDILGTMSVPVIFITAFPERLLTGERPEPTYLITKPFGPETVTATIGQALLFHREAAALTEPHTRLNQASPSPDPHKDFATPESLLADDALSTADKQVLLTEWDSEMDGRLSAESEGMGSANPLSARQEGHLAEAAGNVKSALVKATQQLADEAL